MTNEFLAILYGLLSAFTWGAGDFSGGLASKTARLFTVVVVSQLIGAGLILLSALAFSEAFPSGSDLMFGAVAGVMGAFGLLAFYRGLAIGQMGVVAPVAAVVSAIIPVIVGIFFEGWPGGRPAAGFLLAVAAVWLVSAGGESKVSFSDLGHAVVAGTGFALFFVFIDQVRPGSVFWPLVAARAASITLMFGFAFFTKRIDRPTSQQMPLIIMAGFFDTGGNVFFTLAAQAGRLDISAVLSSLYSAVTVFLAWVILKEKMTIRQWAGVAGAFIAVILISQ